MSEQEERQLRREMAVIKRRVMRRLATYDPDKCSECGEPNDNGEGYDGRCGNCADKTFKGEA